MFYLDDNVINDIISQMNRNIYQVENMSDGYLGKMAPLINSGMYGNGVETINSQMLAIKEGYTHFRNITQNNLNSIVNMENKMTQMARDIPLPVNFDASDTSLGITINNSILEKHDGLSVNAGVDTVTKNEMTDFYDVENEKLFKLKNLDLTENILKEYKETEKDDIYNINNENETKEEKIDDYKQTKKENIYNINNGNMTDIERLNDYIYTKKEEIEDISNNEQNSTSGE